MREILHWQRCELLEAQCRVVLLDIAATVPILNLQGGAALEVRRRIDGDRAIMCAPQTSERMRRLKDYAVGTDKHGTSRSNWRRPRMRATPLQSVNNLDDGVPDAHNPRVTDRGLEGRVCQRAPGGR